MFYPILLAVARASKRLHGSCHLRYQHGMRQTFNTLADLLGHGFDTIIDVRSPAEFVEDHIPGAINLPALTNDQRAEVGTIYVQVSAFKARKIGAAMVARNVADHLQGPLADKDGGWRPLVYCWRGGQRSGSFASILDQIGWRAGVIDGGYQSFRRLVYDSLYQSTLPFRLILVDGYTGTGKTEILQRLGTLGHQVVDLEGLANHRGSLLGGMDDGQPSQKAFETALACTLARLDPNRPVLIEAESSKIGGRIIPPSVWSAMKAAPRVTITAPPAARAAYLAKAYRDLSDDRLRLAAKLDVLRRHRGALVDGWQALLASGDMTGLAHALIEGHYDPTYRASHTRHSPEVLASFETADLGEDGLNDVAARLSDWISRSER